MADLQIRDPAGATRVVPINKPRFRLGKRPDNEVILDHVEVSRYHCEINVQGGSFILRDLDSTNGTRIGGERIQAPVTLKNGVAFTVGGYTLTFRQKDDSGAVIVNVEEDRTKAVLARLGPRLEAGDLAGKGIHAYLVRARELGASDLHLTTGAAPFVRVHGQVLPLHHPPLTPHDTERFVREVLRTEELEEFQRRPDLDLCYQSERDGRYRANAHRQAHGLGLSLRVLPEKIPTLQELGLPDALRQFTHFHQGIVLVTGPAGCGKSSTMAALVEIINQEKKRQIITIEDPIEFGFQSRMSTVVQRQVRVHTQSWANALRSALREDPDVIVVGELRDLEAVSVAITAAETGHLVLGTLHTCGAIKTIDRILDSFPPAEQPRIRVMISESLRGVISQQLIPTADGSAQAVALEVMFTTPAVSNLIREQKTYQIFSVIQTGRRFGMCLMDDSLAELVAQGRIAREDALAHAEDPKRFMDL